MKKLITVKIQNLVAVLAIAWLALAQVASAQQVIDVYDTTDPDNWIMIGNIQTILSPQSGGAHYNFYSASSHALCVDLGYRKSNIWVHENSNATDDLTFGFVFHNEDDSRTLSPNNTALLDFRIVDSTSNPSTVVSDDPGEAVETPAGSDAFKGKFTYNNRNTDGIAVSGVSGGVWTIIIDSVSFGAIQEWKAAGGGISNGSSCLTDLSDLTLEMGHEYRLTPEGNLPSGAPVDATLLAAVAGPDQTVADYDFVQLNGSDSSPLGKIGYTWSQVGGSPVSLSDVSSANPTFQAPSFSDVLTFELVVDRLSNGELSDPDSVTITVVDTDDDDDGVGNDVDQCPATPAGALVGADGCSGAQNIANACPVDGDYKNHGQYVSCVSNAADAAVLAGLLTEEEAEDIVSAAGRSEVAKPANSNSGKGKNKDK